MANDQNKRIDGIDFLKGILILLVISGHILLGSYLATAPDRSFVRCCIYSFHMPLFLALSGYLLSAERIDKVRAKPLLKKYWARLLLPWGLAFLTFFVIHEIQSVRPLRLRHIVSSVLYPDYHLWYGYALFAMIIGLFIVRKVRIDSLLVLFSSLILTGLYVMQFYEDALPKGELWFLLLGDKRVYYYFSFFFLGFYIRNCSKRCISSRVHFSGFAMFASLQLWHFFHFSNASIYATNYVFMNVFLILFCMTTFPRIERLPKAFRPILWIGRYSLPIYLWHPIITREIGKNVILPEAGHTTYFVVAICGTFLFFLPMIHLLSKVPFINRYVFGNYYPSPRLVIENNSVLEEAVLK